MSYLSGLDLKNVVCSESVGRTNPANLLAISLFVNFPFIECPPVSGCIFIMLS